MGGGEPYDGLATHPRGSTNTTISLAVRATGMRSVTCLILRRSRRKRSNTQSRQWPEAGILSKIIIV